MSHSSAVAVDVMLIDQIKTYKKNKIGKQLFNSKPNLLSIEIRYGKEILQGLQGYMGKFYFQKALQGIQIFKEKEKKKTFTTLSVFLLNKLKCFC